MTLLSGSANCIRYVLFAFNLLFVITGIILISVGATVAGVYRNYETFLFNSKFFSIPTFLIVTGSFIFIIAFFGCYGAMKENYCMTVTFSVLLGLIFIFELAAGISGYVLRNSAAELIQERLKGIMPHYNDSKYEDVTMMFDKVQRKFQCCGIDGWADWPKVNASIPLSCCNIPDGVSEYKCTSEPENTYIHRKGCLALFGEFISVHAVSLGAAGVILAIIQFAGIFFACYVSREIKIRTGAAGLF